MVWNAKLSNTIYLFLMSCLLNWFGRMKNTKKRNSLSISIFHAPSLSLSIGQCPSILFFCFELLFIISFLCSYFSFLWMLLFVHSFVGFFFIYSLSFNESSSPTYLSISKIFFHQIIYQLLSLNYIITLICYSFCIRSTHFFDHTNYSSSFSTSLCRERWANIFKHYCLINILWLQFAFMLCLFIHFSLENLKFIKTWLC